MAQARTSKKLMSNPEISIDSTICAVPEQASCDLQGEAAVLNLKSGTYYGLNEVGARVWQVIQKPVSVRAVRDALLREFDVASAQCEHDLFLLLDDLAAARLINVSNENAA